MIAYKNLLRIISTVVGNTLAANKSKKLPFNVNVRIDNIHNIKSLEHVKSLVDTLNSKCSDVKGLMNIVIKNYEELERGETGVVILECKIDPKAK